MNGLVYKEQELGDEIHLLYLKIIQQHSNFVNGPSDMKIFETFYGMCEEIIKQDKRINDQNKKAVIKKAVEIFRGPKFNADKPE